MGRPPGVICHLGRVSVWVCEGGGALHTHPLLAGQVCMAWQWWQDGWWEWRESDEVVCHSPAGRRLYRRSPRLDWALPPSHGGGGVTAGLGAGRVTRVIVAEWSDPQTTTPTHHTHLKAPGHRAVPPRWRCRRAAPGAWWPPQCPCACRRRGQGMGQGGAPSPWRAREVCHVHV